MASIRILKKDIDFLATEIISDCQLFMYLNPKSEKSEKALSIIEETIDMCNELYERANNPNGKEDRKLLKQHYASIRQDLVKNSHKLFEQISSLSK